MYTGAGLFAELVYVEDWENDTTNLAGKVALTFAKEDQDVAGVDGKLGCEAVIIARSSDYLTDIFVDSTPSIAVDYEVGTKILQYIRFSRCFSFYFFQHLPSCA